MNLKEAAKEGRKWQLVDDRPNAKQDPGWELVLPMAEAIRASREEGKTFDLCWRSMSGHWEGAQSVGEWWDSWSLIHAKDYSWKTVTFQRGKFAVAHWLSLFSPNSIVSSPTSLLACYFLTFWWINFGSLFINVLFTFPSVKFCLCFTMLCSVPHLRKINFIPKESHNYLKTKVKLYFAR